ncbi:Glutamate decarboxylase alpha [Thiorhodovibrio winogradskyi]|uniref:Glutamate decarboxylase n=1 Tax=Thiorhodovibrio winogradskyi TaxID=77007 RepID=A0ABZ0SIR8_9GAMM|nr:glutamate decarboxylase [Thiorhodovibrio winogradskyi]
MVTKKIEAIDPENVDALLTPAYARRGLTREVPKFRLPEHEMAPSTAYDLIHDELMLDGNARLNLATFVTTWMEPEAERLMAETFDKNMIDKDEYPRTAAIEERCINIVSDLFNAPEQGVGASAIGSSEAVMLAGMALKWRWRERRRAQGKPSDKPNLVLGANVQVVWEKFCRYWEVEPRYIPMEPGRYVIQPEEVIERIDENTIGAVAILGTTFTGEYEPIEAIHDALVAHNAKTGWEVPLHVDAASGGFVAPFLQPELQWDFRLPLVKSINVSGHKFGLVYPGVGWVVWRSHVDLPEDLVFRVNYLGGDMPTFTLNFSRPGNQVVGQYYNFLRLGRAGYTAVMRALRDTAMYVSAGVAALGPFELVSNGSNLPVFAFKLKDSVTAYSVFDISRKLRENGWQVPAYTMPEHAEQVAVLRIVVREGFSRDMAEMLLADMVEAVNYFDAQSHNQPSDPQPQFAH